MEVDGACRGQFRTGEMDLDVLWSHIYDLLSNSDHYMSLLMKSSALESLSPTVRRSLAKLGTDIATARRKRNLTMVMMAERIGAAKTTYMKVEKGDPSVSMGVYAMALFVLGFGEAIGDIVDPGRDDVGLLLDIERLPKRVRPKKAPTAL